MSLNRLTALLLLSECTGDDIWSIEHCQRRGVPQGWIDELSDCFESGFQHDSQTIHLNEQIINQYEGIRDVDLAIRLGDFLGIDVHSLHATASSRASLVKAIKQAVEEE